MEFDHLTTRSRRTVLAGLGAVGLGSLASGSASANGDDSNGSNDGSQDDSAGFGYPPPHLTEWGDPVEMGNGEAKTFVTVNSADMPMFVGVHFTTDALAGLGDEHNHFSLQFPGAVEQTPFQFVGMDWGPEGHGPPGVYDVPHFDMHFYLMPESEVNEIPAVNFPPGQGDDDPYTVPIPEDQFPPNYAREHSVVPRMGEHLFDATAPELDGADFTNTFIWGHWESELIFYEPMITVEYLELLRRVGRVGGGVDLFDTLLSIHGHDTREISMPERFPEAGRYPTEYSVRYHGNDDAFTVSLVGFQPFEASEGVQNDGE